VKALSTPSWKQILQCHLSLLTTAALFKSLTATHKQPQARTTQQAVPEFLTTPMMREKMLLVFSS
jgi:hypothetical protein